jgi:GNAT superfamily N-acetyltransferase
MAWAEMPGPGALRSGEAGAAVALSVEAGWNQVEEDWRFMLAAGIGFAGRDKADGRLVGSALVLPVGPALAWIGMVLVAATHRRLGLGTALFGRCLDACAEQGLVAGLDATELGRPVYERLGFVDVLALRRWRLERPVSGPAAGAGPQVAAVSPADLAAVAAFDAARSGMSRPAILAHLATRGPGFVARDAGGALAGYVLSRNGRTAMQVGPLVARDAATARALLATATSAARAPFVLDVPEPQEEVAALLRDHGASSARGFMRMTRGAPGALASPAGLFAISGPELG